MIFCSSGWGSVRKALWSKRLWSKQKMELPSTKMGGLLTVFLLMHLKKNHFIYLFLVELSLRYCPWAFSSFGKQGATLHCGVRVSLCGGFSCYRA